MKQPVLLRQAKRKLCRDLAVFYVHDFINDVLDIGLMYISKFLVLLFHFISGFLPLLRPFFQALGLRAVVDFLSGLDHYYISCMKEIEQRTRPIIKAAERAAQESANIKYAAKAVLKSQAPISYYSIISAKIQLTMKERGMLAAHVSAFLLFILRAITFMA